jgi:cytochrome c oxidase assembly protein subunit 17
MPGCNLPPLPYLPAADTKKVRDACVVTKGEEFCKSEIDAHKACLREEGFSVPH